MDISSYRVGQYRSRGLTLVEMVATVAIAGIILTTGIPGINRLLASNQQTSELNRMVAFLHLARSEAVMQGKRATLCPSHNGSDCLTVPEWHQGYILFMDDNRNRRLDGDERLLRSHSPEGRDLMITSTAGRKYIIYQPDGASPGTNLTITFCDQRTKAPAKAVILANTGRPRVSKTKANGNPLTCG